MKKILLLAVVAAAMMFGTTSCIKNKMRCFKTTVVYQVEGQQKTEVRYTWATVITDLAEQFAESLIAGFTGAKIVSNESIEVHEYKTREDCLAQNPVK